MCSAPARITDACSGAVAWQGNSQTTRKDAPGLNLLARLKSDISLMLRRPPRQQYAALCHRSQKKPGVEEVLLLTRRDTGRWVIPRGWRMPGNKAQTVAAREAHE